MLFSLQESSKGMRNLPRMLVFANRIKTVRFLHSTISAEGFKAAMLHGDRSQAEREVCV
jgi:ATP-dependent RNA helicase DDX5/DBP2